MIHQEAPAGAARFFGHVCGVIAVAMAALSGWALWSAAATVAHGRFSVGLAALGVVGAVLTALFFRWSGVLTGHWSTHGRLAVPPGVYAAFGVCCAGVSGVGLYLLLSRTLTLWGSLTIAAAIVSGGVVAYWCHLLLRQRRR